MLMTLFVPCGTTLIKKPHAMIEAIVLIIVSQNLCIWLIN